MNIGDVIITAEELDALPVWASVVDSVGDVSQRQEGDCWEVLRAFLPCTIVYLPGRLPRPERVVKAEALRAAAADAYGTERAAGYYGHPLSIAGWLRDRADRIEAGEAP